MVFNQSLNKEQRDKLLEMARWTFEGYTVSIGPDVFTVTTSSNNAAVRSYFYPGFVEVLLFMIPKKLGMDFVVVDPDDHLSLFNQVSEKYDMYKNISEDSVKKSKYENSCGYENDWGGCM